MEYVFLWIVCGIIGAMIGSKKGEGCGGFLVGLILGPFGIVIAIFSKGNRRQCPYCKELIHKDAIICPRCQKDVANTTDNRPKSFMDGINKGINS